MATTEVTSKVHRIERIRLKPGDILLITVHGNFTDKWMYDTNDTIHKTMPGVQCLFVPDNIALKVISQETAMKIKLEQSK
jgi:hypothetical protein